MDFVSAQTDFEASKKLSVSSFGETSAVIPLLKVTVLYPEDDGLIEADVQEQVNECLKMVLGAIRELQLRLLSFNHDTLPLVTIEHLPPMIPVLYAPGNRPSSLVPVSVSGGANQVKKSPFHLPETVHEAVRRPPSLDLKARLNMNNAIAQSDAHKSDYWAASLRVAAGIENYLIRLVLHCKWEEGDDLQKGADVCGGLSKNIKSSLPRYLQPLGGKWDKNDHESPFYKMYRDVFDLRNKVIHRLYVPAEREYELSRRSAQEFLCFLEGQLGQSETIKKLPITSLAFSSVDNHFSTKKQKRKLINLQRNEKQNLLRFVQWEKAVRFEASGRKAEFGPVTHYVIRRSDSDFVPVRVWSDIGHGEEWILRDCIARDLWNRAEAGQDSALRRVDGMQHGARGESLVEMSRLWDGWSTEPAS